MNQKGETYRAKFAYILIISHLECIHLHQVNKLNQLCRLICAYYGIQALIPYYFKVHIAITLL